MIVPNEKVYRGKFRYESHKTKAGRISISSKVTRLPNFPFENNTSVHVTFRDDYLIIEPWRNDRIEPIIKDSVCDVLDCDNNIYGKCDIKIRIDKAGHCMNYKFSRNKFDESLSKSVKHGLVVK